MLQRKSRVLMKNVLSWSAMLVEQGAITPIRHTRANYITVSQIRQQNSDLSTVNAS